ncbi:MAG: hypothetical protein ABSA16_07990 [Thermoguttaceae bacterium]|jgi:hypothetical protein
MPIHIKTMLLGLSVAAALGFAADNSAAQSTGPAALAAKQKIKNQVLAAMDDGKITEDERRNILSHAKDILSAKEYVGLVETINRLSPPDHPGSEELGYTPVVDKQLMAKFYTPDLSRLEKSKAGEAVANQSFVKEITPDPSFVKEIMPNPSFLAKIMPKQSFLNNHIPNQTNVVKETAPKTYIVKEIITKQTIVSTMPPNQSVVKESTPKQTVVKAATSKQTVVKAATPKQTVVKESVTKPVVKTTKPSGTAKTANVVILPPPPHQQKNNSQPNPSTVGKVQKTPKSNDPAPPMPVAGQSQTRNTAADKPVRQKMVESPKEQAETGNQAAIQQPTGLLREAEKTTITHSYADYSVPVLTTPAAALLNNPNNTIQASFDQPLEPDRQGIIK